MNSERIEKQLDFCKELDKEKFIKRQTLLGDGTTYENDAEHAWHMAVMCLILSEYSNKDIDLLKTISMILIHDVVEIDAGDTYAYDDKAIESQHDREIRAAERIFGLLPDDQKEKLIDLWNEFEENKTNEARFAHTIDNFQPCMLNNETNGKKWQDNKVRLSQILRRNRYSADGSEKLWNYQLEKFIMPNVSSGKIIDDKSEQGSVPSGTRA